MGDNTTPAQRHPSLTDLALAIEDRAHDLVATHDIDDPIVQDSAQAMRWVRDELLRMPVSAHEAAQAANA